MINESIISAVQARLAYAHSGCGIQVTNVQTVKNGFLVQFTVVPDDKFEHTYKHDRVAFFKNEHKTAAWAPEWNFNI